MFIFLRFDAILVCVLVRARVFIYRAEVTSLISPWEKPEAICKIPLIKNKSKSNLVSHMHLHTHTHGQIERHVYNLHLHVHTGMFVEESYLLSRLEHVWASV